MIREVQGVDSGSVKHVDQPAHLHATRETYDAVAPDYARLLPDLRAETALDQAMLSTFAELISAEGLGPVADLGCGTGRVTAHLDALGVEAFGIDLSPAMVDFARSTHPHLRFDVGSITALDLPDGATGGVLAWYSTIHTPPHELPEVFAEFSGSWRPEGTCWSAFTSVTNVSRGRWFAVTRCLSTPTTSRPNGWPNWPVRRVWLCRRN